MFFDPRTVSRIIGALLCLSALGACTPKQDAQEDPKRRLNEYIALSFAVKGTEDRAPLSAYLTGDAKTRLEGWSDEQFRQAFLEAKRQFIKLAFKEIKVVSANEVSITYELTYQSTSGEKPGVGHEAKITNRKLAQMVHRDNQWFIGEVRNIKELLEYKNEMSLP